MAEQFSITNQFCPPVLIKSPFTMQAEGHRQVCKSGGGGLDRNMEHWVGGWGGIVCKA